MQQGLIGLAFAALLALAATVANAFEKTVAVESGTLEGVVSGGVLSFKGVPFAAPPVGDFRWMPPQPAASWVGTRSADAYGPDCFQKPIEGDAAPLGSTLSEDCLYLNIWRPAEGGPGDKLPVMIWIHGGGYVNGGSSAAVFDGSAFARQGIVLVSINYRLGRFGYFAHPALTAASPRPLGNYGTMDQIAALQWVQRNIAAFGGDPARVTIFGESAGGGSVLDLLASHPDEGLFHQAAVLSGGGRAFLGGLKLTEPSGPRHSAEELGVEFARRFGITDTGPEGLAALRRLSAEDIRGDLNMVALFAEEILFFVNLRYQGGPAIDGTAVKGIPADVFRAGEAARVPLIIGATSADIGVSIPWTRRGVFAPFEAEGDAARAIYDPDGGRPFRELRAEVEGDRTMQEPARFIARRMAASGAPAWRYRFGYVAESEAAPGKGAGHASEIPFLFDTLDARFGDKATDRDRAMAKAVNAYFANFAKGGDPNGAGLPGWPKADPAGSEMMIFTPDGIPVAGPDPWTARLDVVERAAEAGAPQ
jgi:para-nitrobenzyl esterase